MNSFTKIMAARISMHIEMVKIETKNSTDWVSILN